MAQRFGNLRDSQTSQSIKDPSSLIHLRPDSHGFRSRTIKVLLHQCDGTLASLVRSILVEDVVEIDEKGAQVLDLLLGMGRILGQNTGEFEEVEEE